MTCLCLSCRWPYDQHEMLVFAQQAGSLLQNVRRIRQVPRQRPEVSTSPNTFIFFIFYLYPSRHFYFVSNFIRSMPITHWMENIFLKIESDRRSQNIVLIKIRFAWWFYFLCIIIEISPFLFLYYMINIRYSPNYSYQTYILIQFLTNN